MGALAIPPTLFNVANGGETSASMLAQYSASVAAHFNPNTLNVLTIMIGANDFVAGTATATTYANILSEVAAAQATGFQRVIVFTNTSHNGLVNALTGDQWMQDLASKITGGAVAHNYSVCDVNSDTNLGITGAYADTLWFQDGIHPTQTGQNRIATVYLKTCLAAVGIQ